MKYPLTNCHFCDHIIIYTRYDNGINYGYCNNPASCMSFQFINDPDLRVNNFELSYHNLQFKANQLTNNILLAKNSKGTFINISNNLLVDTNLILDKEKMLNLLAKLSKLVSDNS